MKHIKKSPIARPVSRGNFLSFRNAEHPVLKKDDGAGEFAPSRKNPFMPIDAKPLHHSCSNELCDPRNISKNSKEVIERTVSFEHHLMRSLMQIDFFDDWLENIVLRTLRINHFIFDREIKIEGEEAPWTLSELLSSTNLSQTQIKKASCSIADIGSNGSSAESVATLLYEFGKLQNCSSLLNQTGELSQNKFLLKLCLQTHLEESKLYSDDLFRHSFQPTWCNIRKFLFSLFSQMNSKVSFASSLKSYEERLYERLFTESIIHFGEKVEEDLHIYGVRTMLSGRRGHGTSEVFFKTTEGLVYLVRLNTGGGCRGVNKVIRLDFGEESKKPYFLFPNIYQLNSVHDVKKIAAILSLSCVFRVSKKESQDLWQEMQQRFHIKHVPKSEEFDQIKEILSRYSQASESCTGQAQLWAIRSAFALQSFSSGGQHECTNRSSSRKITTPRHRLYEWGSHLAMSQLSRLVNEQPHLALILFAELIDKKESTIVLRNFMKLWKQLDRRLWAKTNARKATVLMHFVTVMGPYDPDFSVEIMKPFLMDVHWGHQDEKGWTLAMFLSMYIGKKSPSQAFDLLWPFRHKIDWKAQTSDKLTNVTFVVDLIGVKDYRFATRLLLDVLHRLDWTHQDSHLCTIAMLIVQRIGSKDACFVKQILTPVLEDINWRQQSESGVNTAMFIAHCINDPQVVYDLLHPVLGFIDWGQQDEDGWNTSTFIMQSMGHKSPFLTRKLLLPIAHKLDLEKKNKYNSSLKQILQIRDTTIPFVQSSLQKGEEG